MADENIKKTEEAVEEAAQNIEEKATEAAEQVVDKAEAVAADVADKAEGVADKADEAVEAVKAGKKAEKPAKQVPPQPLSKKKAKAARRAAAAEAEAAAAEAEAKAKAESPEGRAEAKAAKKVEKKKKRKTRLSKAALIVLVIIGCAAMVISVSSMACSGAISSITDDTDYKLTGGVAATVNGTKITEDTISEQIMSMRESYGYDSDEDWAQYLVDNDLTPESLRESLINSYAQQYLVEVAENDNGVEVTDEEVEKAWKDAYANYDSEETFVSMLKLYGYDEDSYKSSLKSSLAQDKLKDIVAPDDEVTDDDILTYLNENLSTYNDARRSSHILIKVESDATDDEKAEAKEKAQECLDKINSGEMTWDEAVEEYSDDASKDDGGEGKKGDVGYDKLNSFVDEYETALAGLNKGDISGLVESTYGYHIIKCTNYWHVDGSVASIDDAPKAVKKYIKNVLATQNENVNFNEWLEKYVDEADIQINDMPADVPYNVSLDGVTKSESDDSTSTTTTDSAESSDSTTDESTDDAASTDTTDSSSSTSGQTLAEATAAE